MPETERQKGTETERQRDRETERQRDRHRHTDTQTHRHTDTDTLRPEHHGRKRRGSSRSLTDAPPGSSSACRSLVPANAPG
eukprot:3940562-Rhodomonas_salina.1